MTTFRPDFQSMSIEGYVRLRWSMKTSRLRRIAGLRGHKRSVLFQIPPSRALNPPSPHKEQPAVDEQGASVFILSFLHRKGPGLYCAERKIFCLVSRICGLIPALEAG